MNEDMNRRSFLRFVGTTAAGAVLSRFAAGWLGRNSQAPEKRTNLNLEKFLTQKSSVGVQ